jgi:hypothetical protein
MLDLSHLVVRDHPFQMGTGKDVFENNFYEELVNTFPPVVLAQRLGDEKNGLKYSIAPEPGSEGKQFYAFLKIAPAWKKFHDYIMAGDWLRYFQLPQALYFIRFEFSFLPWENGILFPHKDASPKVFALVLPMTLEDQPEWGGCTEMLDPKDNPVGSSSIAIEPFDKFTPALMAPFRPNSANFLVRSDNSWHGVRCHGPRDQYRKSITLNLVGEGYAKAS